MNKTVFYYLVKDAETGISMTIIGGPLKPSANPEHVWITRPDGERLFEVKRSCIRPSSREELAQRILADARAAKAPLN